MCRGGLVHCEACLYIKIVLNSEHAEINNLAEIKVRDNSLAEISLFEATVLIAVIFAALT